MKSQSDLLFFAQSYDKASGNVTLDLSYLENAKVRAFYSNNHQFLGGYAVSTTNLNPGLRYFEFLDPEQRKNLLLQGYKEEDCAEITFIFFERHTSPIQRLRVLIHSLFDAWVTQKKFILGGGVVSAFNNRMKRVLSIELYSGELPVFGKVKTFKILCAERKNILLKIFNAFLTEARILLSPA